MRTAMAFGTGGIVFVSVPDGYRSTGRFWRNASDASAPIDFPLVPIARREVFRFVHASDTHVAPRTSNAPRRLRTLVDSLRPAFAIITADLIRDALRVPEADSAFDPAGSVGSVESAPPAFSLA